MPGSCPESWYNQSNYPSIVNILAGTLSLFGSGIQFIVGLNNDLAFVLSVYSFIKKKENVSQLILSLTAADLFASLFILLSHILILSNFYGNVLVCKTSVDLLNHSIVYLIAKLYRTVLYFFSTLDFLYRFSSLLRSECRGIQSTHHSKIRSLLPFNMLGRSCCYEHYNHFGWVHSS